MDTPNSTTTAFWQELIWVVQQPLGWIIPVTMAVLFLLIVWIVVSAFWDSIAKVRVSEERPDRIVSDYSRHHASPVPLVSRRGGSR